MGTCHLWKVAGVEHCSTQAGNIIYINCSAYNLHNCVCHPPTLNKIRRIFQEKEHHKHGLEICRLCLGNVSSVMEREVVREQMLERLE